MRADQVLALPAIRCERCGQDPVLALHTVCAPADRPPLCLVAAMAPAHEVSPARIVQQLVHESRPGRSGQQPVMVHRSVSGASISSLGLWVECLQCDAPCDLHPVVMVAAELVTVLFDGDPRPAQVRCPCRSCW